MTATRFEPSVREVSETLTAIVVMGPWGIDGLYDYCFFDEPEWEPHYDMCVNCYGKGYLDNYRECKTCGTSGSLLVALHLSDMREAPEPYLGNKLRRILQEKTGARFARSWDTTRNTWIIVPRSLEWRTGDPAFEAEQAYLAGTRWQDGPLEQVA